MRRLGYALMVLGTATVLSCATPSGGTSGYSSAGVVSVSGSRTYSIYVSDGEIAIAIFFHSDGVYISPMDKDKVIPLGRNVSVPNEEGADLRSTLFLILGEGERVKFRVRGNGAFIAKVARDKNPVVFTGTSSKRYRESLSAGRAVMAFVFCTPETHVSLKAYDPEGYKIASNSGEGLAMVSFVTSTSGVYHYRINVEDEDAKCLFTTPSLPIGR